MSWPHPSRLCTVCRRPFKGRADGQLHAHTVETPSGTKRCPGGAIPRPDEYPLAMPSEIPEAGEAKGFCEACGRPVEGGQPKYYRTLASAIAEAERAGQSLERALANAQRVAKEDA